MQYDPVKGQGQGHEASKVWIFGYVQKLSPYNGSWQLTIDS